MINVKGSPGLYVCEEGALDHLENLLKSHGFKKGILIRGNKSWEAAAPYFPRMSEVRLTEVVYRGECSDPETRRIADIYQSEGAEFVLGVGGGKILDLTKAVANEVKGKAVLVPTLASTCAAWTSLSVIYTEEGVYERLQVYPRSTLMVLIEPRILLDSPVEYMKAGIGDTLAKWYEAEALTRNKKNLRFPVLMAMQGAQLCRDLLLADSAEAIASMERKAMSHALLNIIELNIMVAGLCGGFGDNEVRIAAAHSVHNGLTRLEETHHLLHGEKVAYGILVQLALEGQWEEIDRLIGFYREIGLPYSLASLGVDSGRGDKLRLVAEGALAPGESIHFMEGNYTVDDVVRAMLALEDRYAGDATAARP